MRRNSILYKLGLIIILALLVTGLASCSGSEGAGETISQAPESNLTAEDSLNDEETATLADEMPEVGESQDPSQAEEVSGKEDSTSPVSGKQSDPNSTQTDEESRATENPENPTVNKTETTTQTTTQTTTKASENKGPGYLGQVNLYIDAKNALPHIKGKAGYEQVPASGIILDGKADLYEGDSVALVLKRELDKRSIPYKLEQRNNYLSSLAGLKEKDKNCGSMSGWLYYVNGVSPGVGIGSYSQNMKSNPSLGLIPLKAGDKISFYYTVKPGDTPKG